MDRKLIIDSHSIYALQLIQSRLLEEITPALREGKQIVILCIGTDRSTGDSLGPIVGDSLIQLLSPRFKVYGSLEYPVHAKNLDLTIKEIYLAYKNPFIVAVDASLGSLHNIGNIQIENKPINPGAALNKHLPAIGDISITGIVNVSNNLEFLTLQSTRLFVVMYMANLISKGISSALQSALMDQYAEN